MVCILLTLMAFDAVIVMLIVMLSGARYRIGKKLMKLIGDEVDVYADIKTLIAAAARRFALLATKAIEDHGGFHGRPFWRFDT